MRIIWKRVPPRQVHPSAKPAAEAARAVPALAGNEAFWKFHGTAFKNQRALNRDNFEKWASEAGVKDMKSYTKGLDDHRWAEKVEADMAVGGKAGVTGTPASFINGVFLSGAQPFDAVEEDRRSGR